MKRLRNLLLSVIIGSVFCIPAAALQAASPGTTAYTVYTKDAIQLRVEPKLTGRAIAKLAVGVKVRVNSCAEGWCSVTTQGMTGYVVEELLVRKLSRPPTK
ncbi:MAG TPA: SH3 domain-containing protein [Nitrospirota bacterium]